VTHRHRAARSAAAAAMGGARERAARRPGPHAPAAPLERCPAELCAGLMHRDKCDPLCHG
jgi:hypothetical protein